jgi:hypothetical protein
VHSNEILDAETARLAAFTPMISDFTVIHLIEFVGIDRVRLSGGVTD